MRERLNVLEGQKTIILQKIKNIDTKKLSKKWYVLYEIGYLLTIVTMVLLYKDNLLLAFLLTIGYGLSVPALQAVIDSIKINKLRKEYSSINKEIKEIEKQLYSKNLTEEKKQREILFTPYKPLKITEETRRAVLEHPELYSRLSVRERMGKFYTDEEYEQRREEVLSKPLPGDEKKRYTRKKKR